MAAGGPRSPRGSKGAELIPLEPLAPVAASRLASAAPSPRSPGPASASGSHEDLALPLGGAAGRPVAAPRPRFSGTGGSSSSRGGSVAALALPEIVPTVALADVHLGEQLGVAPYGVVFRGRLRRTPAAVYRVDPARASVAVRERWAAHAQRLLRLAPHPNIAELLGTAVDDAGALLLVSRYCDAGTLRDNLLLHPDVTEAERLSWAAQIANAMAFLHKQTPPIIHGDLAARVIRLHCVVQPADGRAGRAARHRRAVAAHLAAVTGRGAGAGDDEAAGAAVDWDDPAVRAELVAKVGDAGFTDGVTDVRWAAPELLAGEQATTASDVWSFGVLMWELYTSCSRLPYRTCADDDAVVRCVRDERLALPQPPTCPDAVWLEIARCFMYEPPLRPSFVALAASFEHLLVQLDDDEAEAA